MRVVVTRPAQDADRWARELRARGHEVRVLPLIAIEPVTDTGPLRDAWRSLDGFQAAMFVSGNAVDGFRAAAPGQPWPPGTRAWATGPGTVAALARAGVPAAQVDAPGDDATQFDSEALWALVRDRVGRGTRVLLVRGADASGQPAGRDWLASRLQEQGASVDVVVAYRRTPPAWTAGERAQALAALSDGSAWLLSSSEAVRHLAALLPGADASGARAIATHDRIAQAARDAGFGVVTPSRPDLDAVAAALESIR